MAHIDVIWEIHVFSNSITVLYKYDIQDIVIGVQSYANKIYHSLYENKK